MEHYRKFTWTILATLLFPFIILMAVAFAIQWEPIVEAVKEEWKVFCEMWKETLERD